MAVYRFAGFWRRLIAYTIDNTIIIIVFFILTLIIATAFIFGLMSGSDANLLADWTDPVRLAALSIPATILYLVISLAYFTYFHGLKGRTPGKMILGLQVLTTEGAPIRFGTAFLRSVGYLVSSIFYLGFIWAAFDRRKQGWHDKIAGTVVVILPRENEAYGLIIPDSRQVTRPPEAEKRTDEEVTMPSCAAEAEKMQQPGSVHEGDNQKTP